MSSDAKADACWSEVVALAASRGFRISTRSRIVSSPLHDGRLLVEPEVAVVLVPMKSHEEVKS